MATKKGRGRPPKGPSPKDILQDEHIPVNQIFSEEELEIYNNLINTYMKDIEEDELSSNDMDDIMNLAINRVLEFRLLKESKEGTNHLNVATAIEKLRKHSTTIKENLSFRRKDRIDPDRYKGFSIVDLVAEFEDSERDKRLEQEKKLRAEEKKILEKRKKDGYVGNKDDRDRSVREE